MADHAMPRGARAARFVTPRQDPGRAGVVPRGALSGSSRSGTEAVCRRILTEAAGDLRGTLCREGLAARLDVLLDAIPHPWTRVLTALAELVPVSHQPVLALIGQENSREPEAVSAVAGTARLLSELAIAQPRLSLVLIVEPGLFRAYQDQAPESRAKALLRESVIPLAAKAGPEPRLPALLDRNAGSPELAPFFQEAARALEAASATPAGPEQIDRARSAAERFLYECLQRLPETAGLFRLNAALGFPFGSNREIEADLAADSCGSSSRSTVTTTSRTPSPIAATAARISSSRSTVTWSSACWPRTSSAGWNTCSRPSWPPSLSAKDKLIPQEVTAMNDIATLSAVEVLVLTRLLPVGEKGETKAKMQKDLEPLLGHRWSGSVLTNVLERTLIKLVSKGLVAHRPVKSKKAVPPWS